MISQMFTFISKIFLFRDLLRRCSCVHFMSLLIRKNPCPPHLLSVNATRSAARIPSVTLLRKEKMFYFFKYCFTICSIYVCTYWENFNCWNNSIDFSHNSYFASFSGANGLDHHRWKLQQKKIVLDTTGSQKIASSTSEVNSKKRSLVHSQTKNIVLKTSKSLIWQLSFVFQVALLVSRRNYHFYYR